MKWPAAACPALLVGTGSVPRGVSAGFLPTTFVQLPRRCPFCWLADLKGKDGPLPWRQKQAKHVTLLVFIFVTESLFLFVTHSRFFRLQSVSQHLRFCRINMTCQIYKRDITIFTGEYLK